MVVVACKDLVFKNIEAVIFDKDGTLENSRAFWYNMGIERIRLIDACIPGIKSSLLKAFGISNATLDPTGLMAVGSRAENEIAAAAYIAATGCSWYQAKQIAHHAFEEAARYFTKTSESAPLFPDSLAILKSLHGAGLKLGILSADSTAEVAAFVGRHQLQEYIQLSMGTDGSIYKPNPQLLRQACHQLQVEPERVLMVGDSQGDLQMAKNAGAAAAIGIQRENNSVDLAGGDIAIASLLEIRI